MATTTKPIITVKIAIEIPVNKVWNYWTEPQHIMQWNAASDDWHTPFAENDLRAGGRFFFRMEAKDRSFGFDLSGTYTQIELLKTIAYTLDDDRKVKIEFSQEGHSTTIIEEFEAESQNSVDRQQMGWQAILNNFKKYATIQSLYQD